MHKITSRRDFGNWLRHFILAMPPIKPVKAQYKGLYDALFDESDRTGKIMPFESKNQRVYFGREYNKKLNGKVKISPQITEFVASVLAAGLDEDMTRARVVTLRIFVEIALYVIGLDKGDLFTAIDKSGQQVLVSSRDFQRRCKVRVAIPLTEKDGFELEVL